MAKTPAKKVTKKEKLIEEIVIEKPAVEAVDANRQSIVDMLTDMGIDIDNSKTTEELTKDLKSHVLRLNKKVQDGETSIFQARLRGLKDHTNLSDEEFILRLIMLNVPDMYLKAQRKNGMVFYLFTDADAKLTNKQLWERIRHSGINPLSTSEAFNRRLKRPEKYTSKKAR